MGGGVGGRGDFQSEFYIGRNFAKFRPEKYDFDLYKEIFIEKNGPNSPDFEQNKVPKQQIFLITFMENFDLKIYNFDLYKEIFMEEMTPIRQILKKIIRNRQIFMITSISSQEYGRILLFFCSTFISSM